jgi:hypothetical protein
MFEHPLAGKKITGIATDYGLDDSCSSPDRGKRFISFPQRPDRVWGLPSLLSNSYRGLWGKAVGA